MNKISLFEKKLKSCVKTRVKLSRAVVISFLMSGVLGISQESTQDEPTLKIVNINIQNNTEHKGLELGTKGYARGDGSITTGNNNIAIGIDAVATGGNETKTQIEAKLRENQNRLDEIKRQEETVRRESGELEKLRLRHRDVIDAANRVNALRISKQNAKNEYDRLKAVRLQLEQDSQAQLTDFNNKIEDFNNRLKSISQIESVNLASNSDLEEKANRFKSTVENGTNLNLNIDFYKDYIKSHYKALGDLRKNDLIKQKQSESHNYINFGNTSSNYLGNYYPTKMRFENGIFDELSVDSNIMYFKASYSTYRDKDFFSYFSYNLYAPKEKLKEIGVADKYLSNTNFTIPTININTDVLSDNDFNNNINNLNKFLIYRNAILNSLDDNLFSQKEKEVYMNNNELSKKIITLKNEIANLQWKYEQDNNSQHLDLKNEKIKELNKLNSVNLKSSTYRINDVYINYVAESNMKEDLKKYYIQEDDKYYNIHNYRKMKIAKWNKENVDDIKEKNKITLAKLTSDLETELNINRAEIEKINRNIQNAKNSENAALNNYNNITISEADLLLAREYENVIRQINNKEQILLTATERLTHLKNNLTLNDFRDGENAIAFGNNTLASGTNSIAMGKGSITTAQSGISIGDTNLVSGKSSIALGHGNNALGENGISIGQQNSTNGSKSIAIGYGNRVNGTGTSVIGDPNIVYGDNVHILGNDNKVGIDENNKTNNVFILGTNNKITTSDSKDVYILGSNITSSEIIDSVGLGNESELEDHSVSIGNEVYSRKLIYLKDGLVDEMSNEAINGRQLHNYKKVQDMVNVNSPIDDDKIELKNYKSIKIIKPEKDNRKVLPKRLGGDILEIFKEFNPDLVEMFDDGTLEIENHTLSDTSEGHKLFGDRNYFTLIYKPNGDDDEVISYNIPLKDYIKEEYLENDTNNISFNYDEEKILVKQDDAITIDNVKDGTISNTSKEAVNGSQLFALADGTLENINTDKWREKLGVGVGEQSAPSDVANKEEFVANSVDGSNTITLKGYETKYINRIADKVNVADLKDIQDNEKEEIITKIKEQNEFLETATFEITPDKKYMTITLNNKEIAKIPIIDLADSTVNKDETMTNAKPYNYDKNIYTEKEGALKITNVADGEVSDTSTDAINGRVLHNTVESLKTEIGGNITNAINGLPNTFLKLDGSNLTNDNRNGIITKLSDGANATTPTGALITDTFFKTNLDNKFTSSNLINTLEKGSITSSSFNITNGENRLLGNGNLTIELKDNSVGNTVITDNAISTSKVQDAAITNAKLQDSSVSTNKVQDGAITNGKLADGSVGTSKVQDGAITSDKLANNSVTNTHIADNSINGGKIQDGTITNSKLQNGAITNEKIATGTIEGDKLANNSITNTHIANNSIDGAKLQDGTVDNSKLKDNNITGAKLVDGTITESKLDNTLKAKINGKLGADDLTNDLITGKIEKGNVSSTTLTITNGNARIIGTDNLSIELKENSIANTHIADNSINGDKLLDNTIDNSKLKDNNISGAKLLDNSVSTNKIIDNAITTDKVNNGAITNEKLADNSVGTSKIQNSSITNDKLADNSISSDKVQNGAITSDKLANNAVENKHITDNSISGGKIQDGTIDNSKLKDNNISGSKLVDNSVATSKIINGAITNEKLADNSVTGNKIQDGTISKDKLDDALKTEINNKLNRSDINNNLITTNLEKGNVISTTLTVSNGENRVIGTDNLSIELKENSITNSHIADNSLNGSKLKDNSVSGDKLQDNAISTNKVQNGAITKEKLSDALKTELDNKMDKNGNNLNEKDVDSLREKLGINEIAANTNANTVKYDDDTKSNITLGNENKPVLIHNVATPIENNDAVNKIYVDNKLSSIYKEVKGHIDNSVAMAQIPQVAGDKLFSFGAGAAYSGGKVGSFALGISGQNSAKTFIYKASVGMSTEMNWNVGVGFSYSLGEIENNSNIDNKQLDKLENENKALQDKLNAIEERFAKLENNMDKANDSEVSVLIYKESMFRLIGYATNEYKLTEMQKEILDSNLDMFKDREVVVVGYADIRSNEKYNLELGLNRAKIVKEYLEEKGVKVKEIQSMGHNRMLDGNLSNNRVVEIIY